MSFKATLDETAIDRLTKEGKYDYAGELNKHDDWSTVPNFISKLICSSNPEEPNITFERTINAPMDFVLSKWVGQEEIAPGDAATSKHEFIALGQVLKTQDGVVEVTTGVEWDEQAKSLKRTFRSTEVDAPTSCCIKGYGGWTRTTDLGDGTTKWEHGINQHATVAHPLFCCCCCLYWNKVGGYCLQLRLNDVEKKFAAPKKDENMSMERE